MLRAEFECKHISIVEFILFDTSGLKVATPDLAMPGVQLPRGGRARCEIRVHDTVLPYVTGHDVWDIVTGLSCISAQTCRSVCSYVAQCRINAHWQNTAANIIPVFCSAYPAVPPTTSPTAVQLHFCTETWVTDFAQSILAH